MIKENLAEYIKFKTGQVKGCQNKDFESLFNIIHDQDDRIFCEYIDNLQLKAISYKNCKEYCCKMGAYLKPLLKSNKDCFVGLLMENSIDWVATFWGLLMIGYKPLLLNTKLPDNINNEVLATVKCSEIITTKEFANNNLSATTIVVDRKQVTSAKPLEDFVWADEIALCTTASSLNYKICVYSGKNIYYQMVNADDVISSYCPRVKEHYHQRLKLLAFLPMYHIFGLFATYLWFSLYGRTIVFLKDYSANTIINTIREFEITHIFAVPLFWNTIAREINRQVKSLSQKKQKKFSKGQKLGLTLQNINWKVGRGITRKLFKEVVTKTLGKSVVFIISGGGYIASNTLKLFNAIGYPLLNGYGTSEIGIICFENRNKPKYRLLDTCGKALKTVEVKVEDNVLWVKGLSTCKYYYTKDGIRHDLDGQWFNTRDIAKIDEKGYITILGRQDDVIINESGEKINPDLIEKQLILPSVTNYVVICLNHKTSLIVQLRKKINSLDLNKTINEITNNVEQLIKSGYVIDSVYYTYDQLAPKNAIKVSRKILQVQMDKDQIHLEPLSNLKPIEKINDEQLNNEFVTEIKNVFAEVLNKDPKDIGINQHLILDLCATSLDYLTILTKLENDFDIKFDFQEKSCQTVQSFANYIIKAKKGEK